MFTTERKQDQLTMPWHSQASHAISATQFCTQCSTSHFCAICEHGTHTATKLGRSRCGGTTATIERHEKEVRQGLIGRHLLLVYSVRSPPAMTIRTRVKPIQYRVLELTYRERIFEVHSYVHTHIQTYIQTYLKRSLILSMQLRDFASGEQLNIFIAAVSIYIE